MDKLISGYGRLSLFVTSVFVFGLLSKIPLVTLTVLNAVFSNKVVSGCKPPMLNPSYQAISRSMIKTSEILHMTASKIL